MNIIKEYQGITKKVIMNAKNKCLTKLSNFLNEVPSLVFIVRDEKQAVKEPKIHPKTSPSLLNACSSFCKDISTQDRDRHT